MDINAITYSINSPRHILYIATYKAQQLARVALGTCKLDSYSVVAFCLGITLVKVSNWVADNIDWIARYVH